MRDEVPHHDSRKVAGAHSAGVFPETLWSAVLKAGVQDPERASESIGRLCAVYRNPIYIWLRRAGYSHHAAEDAAQDFVHHLLRKERLPTLNPEIGRFRTWLLRALRNLLRDQYDARIATKRGGGVEHVALDGYDLAAPSGEEEAGLDRDLARVVHERALESVQARWRATGREARFEVLKIFAREDPADGSYEAAGARIGLTAKQVKRAVFELREGYSEAYRTLVADLTEPSDLAAETKYLLSCELDSLPAESK